MTSLVGALVEAWGELRYGKPRVLLSLVGVGIAIAALTAVIAAGQIATQAIQEQNERSGGRPAILTVSAADSSGAAAPDDLLQPALATEFERYRIDYASRTRYLSFELPERLTTQVGNLLAVDPAYATMHRLRVTEGDWFTDSDAQRLAPPIVINQYLWQQLGSPPISSHPVIDGIGPDRTTAVVVGVAKDGYPYADGWVLVEDADRFVSGSELAADDGGQRELWVPPRLATQLASHLRADLRAQLGSGWDVQVDRNDYAAYQTSDPLLPLKLGVGGVAGLVLLLGALGLLNIALVTVRYRIREIGIRRSFGATAPRVFFSVMMESVVATAVAGFAGVILAILALENPLVQGFISQGVQDLPPFPLSAALLGMLAATAVGALAGLLPALVAVRVKVIDAIRY